MPFDPFAQFRMTDQVALITGGAKTSVKPLPSPSPWPGPR
jgi:hypothetical protein